MGAAFFKSLRSMLQHGAASYHSSNHHTRIDNFSIDFQCVGEWLI